MTVGCWNIEGVYEKINSVKVSKLVQPFFHEVLKKHDIMCLQETHIPQDETIPKIDGYETIPHCRKISANHRFFGGILVFVKTCIKNGIKVGRNFDDDVLEITLLKNYFGLCKDTKLLFTYASPINSPYTVSKAEHILEKIETRYIDDEGNTIIMGDLNGRTKTDDDFVRDKNDKHSPINVSYYTKDEILQCRHNLDAHTIDEQGKIILGLCKNSDLRILNGRTPGDENGSFTRYPSNLAENPSTIDYALCSESLIDIVQSFSVLPFTGLSDHCCISLKIKLNTMVEITHNIAKRNVDILKVSKLSLKYDKTRKHIYEKALTEDMKIEELRSIFAQTNMDIEGVDRGIFTMNTILINAAKKASFTKRVGNSNKVHKKCHSQEWYTKECKSRQKILRKNSKDLSTYPFDKVKRQKFIKARVAYKKVCRKAEAESRRRLTNKLMEIGQSDPKLFWSTIKKMNNWGKKNTDPTDDITPKKWMEYFKKLLNDDNAGIIDILGGNPTFEPTLDSMISAKELRAALGNLKGGKAPGPDEIIGEYLKIFGERFEDILLKIVNVIFSEHIYPSKWTLNFLKPIFKKGSTTDPDNYRGLAIGSAFAKLFSFILLKRLINFMDSKALLSPEQIGFIKGKSTSDHIFFLQTIVEKVVKKNKKKLYAVFIDFKKAYDTVNRKLLMKKLQALGINGTFMRNIMTMYRKTEYSVKLKDGHTSGIMSNLGLKQGCPLSPMLFNLYIDDIKDIFDDQCDPIDIQNTNINHFLYADDLVMLSESKAGLQRCINKACNFAKAKYLTINVKKSKTMVFNLAGKFIRDSFTLDSIVLEPVQSFCYLGVDIKCSGTVKHAMSVLNDKGGKALRPLLSAIARFNIPVKTSIKLFHTYISPILLYNTENLSTLTENELTKFDENFIFSNTSTSKIDITHRKLMKFILGVSRSCPNLAIYGDTGETPISIKSYRLTLNFWHRVTNLPNTSLAKKALLENIHLRTNWIKTIEKLINTLNLADKIGNHEKFKKATKYALENGYQKWWKQSLDSHDQSRLLFYKKIKLEFGFENYLKIPGFQHRRHICKLRCSDHVLEIEKGRHKKGITRTLPHERICTLCNNGQVEDEEHFLFKCVIYNPLRTKHKFEHLNDSLGFFNEENLKALGKYLIEAFEARERIIKTQRYREGRSGGNLGYTRRY